MFVDHNCKDLLLNIRTSQLKELSYVLWTFYKIIK